MNNLINNWKTSSAGIVLIITGLIHIVFGLIHKSISEQDFTTTMVSIVTGIGLIVAGDGGKSSVETKTKLADLQNQISQVKTDTSTITKPNP